MMSQAAFSFPWNIGFIISILQIRDQNLERFYNSHKKRWQEYTEELYKKDLHNPDNHDGVITHLEPDFLECEVKWALESITTNKASGCMEFQLSYFKS